MVFICPSKEQSERRKDVICKLKTIVDKLTEEEGPVPIQMCPPPQMCIHPCYAPPPCPAQPSLPSTNTQNCNPPDIMVCYKIKKPTKSVETKKTGSDSAAQKNEAHEVKQSRSRELRGGLLYSGCDCEKRNGLQDDCQRSECRGSPACLTKPNPTCGPSQFSNGKHLGKKSIYKSFDNNNGNGGGGVGGSGGDGSSDMGNGEEFMCFPAVLDMSHVCPC